ncbi:methyltransferase domain-containing protein [Marivirga sp. S37H4]|uniref:Methyltransferase domain-containing protein n=1 Tax=Marivirga aurantiaca TaxID=2802615 RepID=A0A934X2J7_9BACT|nr:methyltransferase domain-containing protein [Marivirga aurantiaca]MBK6267185.1 methyltransferase domain-containing protein [Marivirga aurantiaca]
MHQHIPENTSKNTHNIVFELLNDSGDPGKVLDIPSGAGAFTNRLINQEKSVYSADIENIMKVENPNFAVADMNKVLPYDNGFFDSVVCIDGIEHLENPFFFIRECSRVIKQEGQIVISTPNINSFRSRWRWFWTSHHNKCKVPLNEEKPTPLHHINMMSYQRMRYILHTNGFKIVQVKTNRVKLISWIYAIFIPFSWVFTNWVFKKEEKDKVQRKNNQEILSTLFKTPLLFGETMIIKAIRK